MVHSQSNFSLTATVRDNHNRTIEGVTIRLARHTGLTDSYGNFKIEKIKNSSFEIIAKARGYDIFKRKIEIKEGNNQLDMLLLEEDQKIEAGSVIALTKRQIAHRMASNVTSIAAQKDYNSTLNISDALDQGPGVRVREHGRLGSNLNLAINGFSGKHLRFFTDGVPMDTM